MLVPIIKTFFCFSCDINWSKSFHKDNKLHLIIKAGQIKIPDVVGEIDVIFLIYKSVKSSLIVTSEPIDCALNSVFKAGVGCKPCGFGKR